MPKIVIGDLLDAKETYLCHQCNCVTNRSLHLAKSVFSRFPYADIYSGRTSHDVPGSIIVKGDGITQRFVINILGQYYPGKTRYPDGKRDGLESRLSYFSSALKHMEHLSGSFAFPWRIGCGAAGGNWDDYYALIVAFESIGNRDVTIYRLPSQVSPPAVSAPTLF